MQIMYLEDISESWKAETLEKFKRCSHKTPQKQPHIDVGQKGLVLFGDAHSGVGRRNKVSLYLLGHVF